MRSGAQQDVTAAREAIVDHECIVLGRIGATYCATGRDIAAEILRSIVGVGDVNGLIETTHRNETGQSSGNRDGLSRLLLGHGVSRSPLVRRREFAAFGMIARELLQRLAMHVDEGRIDRWQALHVVLGDKRARPQEWPQALQRRARSYFLFQNETGPPRCFLSLIYQS